MKPELLVMAGQHTAVNTFPGLELEIPEACELTERRQQSKVESMIGVKS